MNVRRIAMGVLTTLSLFAVAGVTVDRAGAAPTNDEIDENNPPRRISLDNAAELPGLLRDSSVRTIIMESGVYRFGGTLQFFRSRDLVLCSASGNPADVTITLADTGAPQLDSITVIVDQVTDVTIRGITIEHPGVEFGQPQNGGTAVFLRGVQGVNSLTESFVDDVTFERCVFRAATCIRGTAGSEGVSVDRCRLVVQTGDTPEEPSGTTDARVDGRNGILWDDGTGLFVHRSEIETSGVNDANGGIVVQGTFPPGADGDRVQRLVITRNDISGTFDNGMQLVDLRDARIRRNKVTCDDPIAASGGGRFGIFVQRAASSRPVEGYEIRKNRIKRAHTGILLLNTRSGVIAQNKVVKCGSSVADNRLGNFGTGLQIQAATLECLFQIRKNRFNGLRSPAGTPATSVNFGGGDASECFPAGHGNSTDRKHPLF